ncbi:hypothetical protein L596_014142 [Steinernema carpocapsae]|uniref:RanBD1 domain-containing protein n=1 Tax=Steinernema carpocapsae TaxID=34508 RepID=A0A4U5NBV5_STECR|nr:hypothetical protein L596_014142 [Steinernema carpocapsae]
MSTHGGDRGSGDAPASFRQLFEKITAPQINQDSFQKELADLKAINAAEDAFAAAPVEAAASQGTSEESAPMSMAEADRKREALAIGVLGEIRGGEHAHRLESVASDNDDGRRRSVVKTNDVLAVTRFTTSVPTSPSSIVIIACDAFMPVCMFSATDFSENPDGERLTFSVRFRETEMRDEFVSAFKAAAEQGSAPISSESLATGGIMSPSFGSRINPLCFQAFVGSFISRNRGFRSSRLCVHRDPAAAMWLLIVAPERIFSQLVCSLDSV